MKDVAVIIINYNSSKYTLECVEAVRAMTAESISYEIIVVDNNSELPQYAILKDNFPKQKDVHLYRSSINTGFGGGNMFGAAYANARYLLFLNNDAMLLNDCLSILTKYMDTHKNVGVCTAQNYNEHNEHVPSFDHNKGLRRLLLGRGFLEKINPKTYPKRKRIYEEPLQVNWVNGAFMFFRSDAFAVTKGFDTTIFLYYEEMDICHRLKKHGFTTILVPEAKILHYQGVSIGSSKAINKEAYISFLYVVRKNYGYIKYLFIKWYLVVVLLLKSKKRYLLSTILNDNRLATSLRTKQKEVLLNET